MMPINISFLGCCKDCPRRSPACSDRCADYQIAKAFHRAEVQWTREQGRRRLRGVKVKGAHYGGNYIRPKSNHPKCK